MRGPALGSRRGKPWMFIEADPDLYSADSCTPLGAALAEGLGGALQLEGPRVEGPQGKCDTC